MAALLTLENTVEFFNEVLKRHLVAFLRQL